MSAPARPPKSKSSSYNNLISEPAQPTPTGLGSAEILVSGLRTSTPAPVLGTVETQAKESAKCEQKDAVSPAKLTEKTSKISRV